MALTRTFLKSMGLTDEQVSAVIEAHAETIEGLTKKRDEYKAEAEKAKQLQEQLDEAKEKLASSGDVAKVQKEFDDYKAGVEAEKLTARKNGAMRSLLKDKVGIKRESALDLILAAEKLDGYELGDNGQFKDADKIEAAMKEKHAEWISTTDEKGVPPTTPPAGGSGKAKMSKDDIAKITDPAKMRTAIAENIELFK